METTYFSELTFDIIQTSGKLAIQFKYDFVEPEHLLLAIIDESLKKSSKSVVLLQTFKHLNINLYELIEDIEASLDNANITVLDSKIPLSKTTERVLKLSFREAKISNNIFIDPEHILLSYLRMNSAFSEKKLIPKYNFTYDRTKQAIKQLV